MLAYLIFHQLDQCIPERDLALHLEFFWFGLGFGFFFEKTFLEKHLVCDVFLPST